MKKNFKASKNEKIYLVGGILLGCLMQISCTDAQEPKPNILFILADDMGWQDTSVPLGPEITAFNQRYQTPSLNRLAQEGILCSQAYSCAVCSPTRVSFLTGQNGARHRVTQWT